MPSKHAMSIHQSMIYGRIMDGKHSRKQRKRIQEKTENVVYDYKYECLDKSGVLSRDDTPCDVNFWTNRPADWFRTSIKYYTNPYDDGALTRLLLNQVKEVISFGYMAKQTRNVTSAYSSTKLLLP